MTEERRDLLDFAVRVATYAGQATLAHFRAPLEVEWKGDDTPVTVADRDAEDRARALIRDRFPGDGIIGEERGAENENAARRWILDPIDGTNSLVHGVPLYGTMVGVEEEGSVVAGVLHFPALGDTVAAATGLGCWWNGRRARVSDTDRLDRALVLTTGDRLPELRPKRDAWNRLADRAGVARTWGDCYGYALVATGRAEAMVDPILDLWDTAAVRPIIEEAGGVFTDWHGEPSHTSGHAIATNAALADVVRDLLKEAL